MRSFLPRQTRTNRTVSPMLAKQGFTQRNHNQDGQRETTLDTHIGQPTHLEYSLARIPLFPPASDDVHISDASQSRALNKKNNTGLPEPLKAGIEHLSGLSLDDVQVHFNSARPAQVQALAYTQGTQIYLGPRQEKHLPHEAWHVVQQKQGRVQPTLEEKGVRINENQKLEQEADVMGMKVNTIQHQNLQGAAGLAPSSNMRKLSSITQQNGLTATHSSTPSGTMTIQKVKPAKPEGAGRNARVFQLRGTWHCRDGRKHWVYNENTDSWRMLGSSKVGLHNRINFAAKVGKGAPRHASFKSRVGSGASYSDTKRRRYTVGQAGEVKYQTSKKRTYRKNMQAATGFASATTYATTNGAPAIPGGYNWCHLLGRGGGGSDAATNIVAASTHANSEHLLMERILYQYKGKGITVDHHYEPFQQGLQIARSMQYQVKHGGKVIFQREVDGLRRDKPSGIELSAVEVKLTSALADALDESVKK